MAKTLKTTLTLQAQCLYQDPLDLSTPEDNLNWKKVVSMATGTGSGLADRVFHDKRTLNAASSEALDLNAGGLVDGLGLAFSPAKIKALLIFVNTATAGGYLLVGGAAANQWFGPFNAATDKVKVGPNSPLVLVNSVDGWAVTAGTADQLKIDNPGGFSIEYEIIMIGTSA